MSRVSETSRRVTEDRHRAEVKATRASEVAGLSGWRAEAKTWLPAMLRVVSEGRRSSALSRVDSHESTEAALGMFWQQWEISRERREGRLGSSSRKETRPSMSLSRPAMSTEVCSREMESRRGSVAGGRRSLSSERSPLSKGEDVAGEPFRVVDQGFRISMPYARRSRCFFVVR